MELTKIRYVNDKREQEFNKLGIFDTADLVKFFPRAYLDLRERQLLKYAYHNDIVLTTGKIVNVPITRYIVGVAWSKSFANKKGLFFK